MRSHNHCQIFFLLVSSALLSGTLVNNNILLTEEPPSLNIYPVPDLAVVGYKMIRKVFPDRFLS